MIVNPDKFKSIILTKNKSDDIPTGFSIGTDIVSIEKSVKLLGIHLDNRLTLLVPCISESCIEIKIKLSFHFHTSLWCLKRFYEGL